MDESEKKMAKRLADAQEALARRRASVQEAWWKRRVAAQEEEVLQQSNLMYGALIGVGIVMVQPFLTAAPERLGLAAKICVLAFALAIPALAALMLLNRQEVYRRRTTPSRLVVGMRAVALAAGFAGVVAGFWNILPAAGVLVLVSGFVAMLVHSAGYIKLEQEDAPAEPEG